MFRRLQSLTTGICLAWTAGCSTSTSPSSTNDVEAPPAQTTETAEPKAEYTVTFDAAWSAATHPEDFPGKPHFSGLIGATHNGDLRF